MDLEYIDEMNIRDTKHSEGAFWKGCTRTRCATYMGWMTEHMGSNETRIGKGVYKDVLYTCLGRGKYLVLSYPPFPLSC